MKMKIKLTKKQRKEINKVYEKSIKHYGIFTGDVYENGVANTIEWLIGETKFNPMKGVKILKKKEKKDKEIKSE